MPSSAFNGLERAPIAGVQPHSLGSENIPKMANSKLIFYRDGVAYVYVNDLDFGQYDSYSLPFNNILVTVEQSAVPETDTAMLSDPS